MRAVSAKSDRGNCAAPDPLSHQIGLRLAPVAVEALRTTVCYGDEMLKARRRMNSYEQDLRPLVLNSLAGDEAAYTALLHRLSALLHRFFRRKFFAGEDAFTEDLVQETLLAIHLNRHRYDPNRPFTAWVYAIARYKLMDHFRRRPAGRIFVPVDDVAGLFSDDAADQSDPGRDIDHLLTHLPEKQSRAIRLVKLDQLSVREASQKMDVSEADIKVSIHRGLKKLMSLVSKEKSP